MSEDHKAKGYHSKSEMKRVETLKAAKEEESHRSIPNNRNETELIMGIKIEGKITIGDLTILAPPNDYPGGAMWPWIKRDSGEGMAMGDATLRELSELLEAFYRKHL